MIYMAAFHGLKLPSLPLPTHHSTSASPRPVTAPWGIVPVAPRSSYFPHLQFNIRDALDDLPRFDWCACSPTTARRA